YNFAALDLAAAADLRFILVLEVAQHALERVGGGLAERAQAGGAGHLVEVLQPLDVAVAALALGDVFQDLHGLPHPLPARHALAAGFGGQPLEEIARHLHHVGVLVHHQQSAGADRRAQLGQLIEIERRIDHARGNRAAHGPAEMHRLGRLASGDAAADVVDDRAQRRAHRHFHHAAVADVARQGHELGSLAACGAYAGVPVGAAFDDLRHVGPGLHVVEVARLVADAGDRRADVLGPRLRRQAFDGTHQRARFARDEDADVEMQLDVEVEARTEDVFAEQSVFPGLRERLLDVLDQLRRVVAGVDVALMRADREGADDQAFEYLVRIAGEEGPVHERAGLAFVTVDDDVLFVAGRILRGFPFLPGGEAAAATAAQIGLLHFVDDLVGRHLEQRLGQRRIAAHRKIVVDAHRIDA